MRSAGEVRNVLPVVEAAARPTDHQGRPFRGADRALAPALGRRISAAHIRDKR
jgi:hypothetical protein